MLIENDNDAAGDDNAGAHNQTQRRRGRPKNPIDGESPKDGGVFERPNHRRRCAAERIGQPHLSQRPGNADADEPAPVGWLDRTPIPERQHARR